MSQLGSLAASASPLVIRATVPEGHAWPIVARLEDDLGALLVAGAAAGNVSAVELTVFEASGDAQIVVHHEYPVAATVLVAATSDARWTVSGDGYGFRHTIDASKFSKGGAQYVAQYVFTLVAGGAASQSYKTLRVEVTVVGS